MTLLEQPSDLPVLFFCWGSFKRVVMDIRSGMRVRRSVVTCLCLRICLCHCICLYSCYCLSVDQFMSHHSDKLAKEGEAVDGDRAVSAATSRQPLCHFAPAPASVTLHCTP